VKADVSIQSDCDAMPKATADRFGAIDILVNDCGMNVH
jgi:NAD(P)-dependent dehydrogenase (short-subunit alcohol dehydrogenase family)